MKIGSTEIKNIRVILRQNRIEIELKSLFFEITSLLGNHLPAPGALRGRGGGYRDSGPGTWPGDPLAGRRQVPAGRHPTALFMSLLEVGS